MPLLSFLVVAQGASSLIVLVITILLYFRPVRQVASEQFFLMATKCTSSNRPVVFFITLLFTVLTVSFCLPTLLLISYKIDDIKSYYVTQCGDVFISSPELCS